MFASSKTPPKPLPTPQRSVVSPGISILKPLSRRGHGPGLIVLCPDTSDSLVIDNGVPWPLMKWAEEGYAVVELQAQALEDAAALQIALKSLANCDECTPKEKVGIVAYSATLWNAVAGSLPSFKEIVAASVYANASEQDSLVPSATPQTHHLGGPSPPGRTMIRQEGLTRYFYPSTKSYAFATPFQEHFEYATEAVSHTRNLNFLKPLIGGPYFDLETIWEEHTYYEFDDRSVEHTMATMVQEPYVNHTTTITGGIGRDKLTSFYRNHFIFNNPTDTSMELISRTIGIDRVVDEFIYKFTHDSFIDWLIPGIPPTGMKAEIPMTAIVNIRGDRLYHEHIAWDQGTVLAQLKLIPEYLPFPYPVPGQNSSEGEAKQYEYRLPIGGAETASKLREKTSVPSNGMFEYSVRER